MNIIPINKKGALLRHPPFVFRHVRNLFLKVDGNRKAVGHTLLGLAFSIELRSMGETTAIFLSKPRDS